MSQRKSLLIIFLGMVVRIIDFAGVAERRLPTILYKPLCRICGRIRPSNQSPLRWSSENDRE